MTKTTPRSKRTSPRNQTQTKINDALMASKHSTAVTPPAKKGKGANVSPESLPVNEAMSNNTELNETESPQGTNVVLNTELESNEKERAREMLLAHINRKTNSDADNQKENAEDAGYESDSTNAASNTTTLWNRVFNRSDPKVKTILFYKTKLVIPANDKFYDALRQVLTTFIETIQEVDSDAKIMKFKDKSNRSFIQDPSDLPTSPSKIKEYFSCNFKARKEESFVWPELRIGFNIDADEFLADVKILLRDKGDFSIFLKDIQAEQIETVGYFLFTSQGHDKQRIVRRLTALAESQYREKITIALRWKKIQDPSTTNRFTPKSRNNAENKPEDPKALHVETIKGEGDRVANILRAVYSTSCSSYPDGEKFRFIPLSKYLQNKNEDEVHAKVLNRQRWFISGSTRATSYEIQDLDITHSNIGKSLRAIILEYKAEDGENLFISADLFYDGGISLLFPKVYEGQARAAIADFGPCLRHSYGDMILVKHFTPEAASRAAEAEWDAQKKCSISGLEKSLNEFVDECDDIAWLREEGKKKPTMVLDKVPPASNIFKPSLDIPLPNDDSSLPTLTNQSLQSQGSQKRTRSDDTSIRSKHKQKRVTDLTDDTSDIDMQTVHTMDTMMSRMDSIESTLANMDAFFQRFQSLQNISTTAAPVQPRPILASGSPKNNDVPASAPTDKGGGGS